MALADPPVAKLAGEEREEEDVLLTGVRPVQLRAQCRGRRAAFAASVAAILLTATACMAPSAMRTGRGASDLQAKYNAAPFLKVLQRQRETQRMQALDENIERPTQIAECVTNLNLAAWKLVQAGSVIAEATDSCPKAEQNPDNKLGCLINIAGAIGATSAATAFFASTAILCPGAARPRTECTVVLSFLMETFATFPEAAGQISLFCPKVTPPPSVEVWGDTRRLAALPAPATEPATASAADGRLLTPLRAPENNLEMVFCTWQMAETLWFFARAGILIRTAVRVCPPDEEEGRTRAGCSEVIGAVITQFLNGAKFIAAAITTCVQETVYPAGCALGTLNLLSAVSQAAAVASALANGACSDLNREDAAESVAKDIRKAQKAKYRTIRKLRSQKKLTKEAAQRALRDEVRDLGLAPPRIRPNMSIVEVLRESGVGPTNSSWPPAVGLSHVRELQRLRPQVERADWGSIEATFREWERKFRP